MTSASSVVAPGQAAAVSGYAEYARLSTVVLTSLLLIGLLHPTPGRANSLDEASRRSVGLLLRMAFDFGGDRIADVSWSDGDSYTLRAGQLATVAAGLLYRSASSYAVEGTVGYKFDKVNGSNGTMEFVRVPVDVVASYAWRWLRVGAGPTVHFAPTFRCRAPGLCDYKVPYDTALGAIAQAGLVTGMTGFDLGVRYTLIRYSGPGLRSIDGSGIGFFLGFCL